MAKNNQKAAALTAALEQIDKKFGTGSAMKMGDKPSMEVKTFSSGSLSIDLALGVGGFPRGRIIEIYGPEASGKTTAALHAIASAQKDGGTAAFIDAEHALDPAYAEALGVDVNELIINQPDYGEQALEIADMLVNSGAVDIIVIDSVAALVPQKELEGEMGDQNMALQARMMSQALRKIASGANNNGTTIIFINQLREKIGVFFGSPEVTTGGKALKFYSSVRVEIRRISALKEGTDIVGNRTRVKIAKNKVAPPFKEAETDIIYGLGFSREGDIIDLGVEFGIIKKAGSWFSYGSERLGQGKETTRTYLRQNPDVADDIDAKIRAYVQEQKDSARALRFGETVPKAEEVETEAEEVEEVVEEVEADKKA